MEEKGEGKVRKTVIKDLLKELGPEKVFNEARKAAREYVYYLKRKGEISFSEPSYGDVPTVHIVRKTLPEIWEDTTMALLGIGQKVHTHYDPGHKKDKYESFPSLEATVMMHITKPFGEPRFHMHFLPQQFGDYKAEMQGVKDHWVLNPAIVVDMIRKGEFNRIKGHTGWLYSYSQRLRNYPYLDIKAKTKTINQIQSVINNLKKEPLSRSAQCTTWDPRFDHNDGQFEGCKFKDYHAPCLQRLWFRLVPFRKGYKINLNTNWRSRDHLKAVPHNIFGLLEGMAEPVRLELQKALKVPIEMGRYVDINDSLHLYGHYFDPRRQGIDAEGYLEDIFRVARKENIKDRLIIPGTPIHEMTLETIETEYKIRVSNPDFGRG